MELLNVMKLLITALSSYCLKCGKNAEDVNARVSKTNNGRTMTLSKCAILGSKKSRFT